jgi:hypothetical protein
VHPSLLVHGLTLPQIAITAIGNGIAGTGSPRFARDDKSA